MRCKASPELWHLHINLHGVIEQNTGICNGIDLRTAYTAPSRALLRWSPLQSLPKERSQDDRAQTISHWLLTAEAWSHSRASPRGIYGSGTASAPSTSVSPVGTFPPTPHTHSLTHLSPWLQSFRNLQRHYTTFYKMGNVHSNAHKVIAGFFLSPEPEVT
jgi:hypothetical protein